MIITNEVIKLSMSQCKATNLVQNDNEKEINTGVYVARQALIREINGVLKRMLHLGFNRRDQILIKGSVPISVVFRRFNIMGAIVILR